MENLKNCTITVMVSNLDVAVQFYVESLGLELKKKYGEHYAEIQGPGLLLGLHPSERPVTKGDNLSIGFGVDDFDAVTRSLQDKGLALEIKQDGFIRLTHFKDPDENHLFVAEVSA